MCLKMGQYEVQDCRRIMTPRHIKVLENFYANSACTRLLNHDLNSYVAIWLNTGILLIDTKNA